MRAKTHHLTLSIYLTHTLCSVTHLPPADVYVQPLCNTNLRQPIISTFRVKVRHHHILHPPREGLLPSTGRERIPRLRPRTRPYRRRCMRVPTPITCSLGVVVYLPEILEEFPVANIPITDHPLAVLLQSGVDGEDEQEKEYCVERECEERQERED
jgi:hypothetical protein